MLGPEGRQLIQESQTPEGNTPYSFGCFLYRTDSRPQFTGHSGSVAGYNAFMVFEPETGIAGCGRRGADARIGYLCWTGRSR